MQLRTCFPVGGDTISQSVALRSESQPDSGPEFDILFGADSSVLRSNPSAQFYQLE